MVNRQFHWIFGGLLFGAFLIAPLSKSATGEKIEMTLESSATKLPSFSLPDNISAGKVLFAQLEEGFESEGILRDADIPSRIDYVPHFGNWDIRRDGSGRTNKRVLSPGGVIKNLIIQVLAPHHPKNIPAPTLGRYPTLYWYVQADIDFPVEFRLRIASTNETVEKIVISTKTRRGIHKISLKDALKPGVNYRWSVYGYADPIEPDDNPYSQVSIRMKKESQGKVFERLEGTPDRRKAKENLKKALQYGKDRYWYDAFMILDDLIETYPGSCKLVKLRSSLLEQSEVNLGFVAKTLNEQAGCS